MYKHILCNHACQTLQQNSDADTLPRFWGHKNNGNGYVTAWRMAPCSKYGMYRYMMVHASCTPLALASTESLRVHLKKAGLWGGHHRVYYMALPSLICIYVCLFHIIHYNSISSKLCLQWMGSLVVSISPMNRLPVMLAVAQIHPFSACRPPLK